MNMFPAQPDTVMRQYDADGDWKEYPVIGWTHVQGNIAFPVFCIPGISVGPGSAIRIGLDWCYPHKGWIAKNEEELEGWVSEYLGEGTEEVTVKDLKVSITSAPKGTVPIKPDGKIDTKPLNFGAKTYNTKSFWHWASANAVFEIEGKEVYPIDPRVVKIKRDEFAKLKRDGAVKIDPHSGLVHGDGEEPTPEKYAGLKATVNGFVDDDEDDVSGLI